ncbi:uncharacterized protein METZ01_LOCUS357561, partial [marine metagenome]
VLDGNKINSIKGSIFEKLELTDNYLSFKDVEVLPPVEPSKIIGLGYNYKDLIGPKKTYQEPVIFLKPTTSLIAHKQTIKIPNSNQKTWVEVELAVIIKSKCKNITKDEASKHILGYTIGNDITTDNIYARDHHLARSKGWDTFCSLGPVIEFDLDTSDLNLTTKINNKIFQNSSTKNRILDDFETVALISNFMTLYPGDIILTGTPANAENSIIKNGDSVVLEIENLGSLQNSVSSI